MTTYEKIQALAARLQRVDPVVLAPELGEVVQAAQILRGMGISLPNPLEFLLPADPAEADQLVDKVIALLFDLRGDDLPPFDPGRYGESVVAELLGADEEEGG